jgi:hypothetical protein
VKTQQRMLYVLSCEHFFKVRLALRKLPDNRTRADLSFSADRLNLAAHVFEFRQCSFHQTFPCQYIQKRSNLNMAIPNEKKHFTGKRRGRIARLFVPAAL